MFKPIIDNIGSFLKIRTQVWYQIEKNKIINTIENFLNSDCIIHKNTNYDMEIKIEQKNNIYIYDIFYKDDIFQYQVEINSKTIDQNSINYDNTTIKKIYPKIIVFTDSDTNNTNNKKTINYDLIPLKNCFCDIKHYFEGELNIIELHVIKKLSYKKLLGIVDGVGNNQKKFRVNMLPTDIEFYMTYHKLLNTHDETFGFLYVNSSPHHYIGLDVGIIG